MQKRFFWIFACEGHNSWLTSAGWGCVEAGPISPVIIGRFEFLKAQNTRSKKWNGVTFMTFFAWRSNRGRYKTEAVSRPDLYILWLLADLNFLKLKMLGLKKKMGLLIWLFSLRGQIEAVLETRLNRGQKVTRFV